MQTPIAMAPEVLLIEPGSLLAKRTSRQSCRTRAAWRLTHTAFAPCPIGVCFHIMAS